MKKYIIMTIAVLSFYFIPDAFAFEKIINTDNKECTTCREIAARYDSLKKELECERNNSEDIEAYENRIKRCKEDFSTFLNTVYEGTFDLDNVFMDWTTNRLITKKALPFEFTGGEDGCKELVVSTVLPHLRLRELMTFKKNICYVITFRLNEDCVMQFMNLKVVYRGEEILNEIDLSSL